MLVTTLELSAANNANVNANDGFNGLDYMAATQQIVCIRNLLHMSVKDSTV